jgi:Raf kinase inhibitor-like YbhB/YbcL family protein
MPRELRFLAAAVLALAAASAAFARSESRFVLTSSAFANGGTIPRKYTCDGAGTSPPLRWSTPPAASARLRLRVVDPDAPGGHFVHWDAERIGPHARGVAAGHHLPGEQVNSFGMRGWGGPCPPGGQTHRYVFTLDALNRGGRVLAEAKLVARYGRP